MSEDDFHEDDLGLPDGYDSEHDSRHIPRLSDLQRAAAQAVAEETAFLILHQDDPKVVAGRLESVVERVLAAIQVKGPHQHKAVRLGLALGLKYWMAYRKVHDWINLIVPLLGIALELDDRELQSGAYRALGIYSHMLRRNPQARVALEKALRYAEQAGREDVRLLMQAEYLHIQAAQKRLDEVEAEAGAILDKAWRLKFVYVQGRTCLTLSTAYEQASLYRPAFAYAQQALACFAEIDSNGLAIEAASAMLGSLSIYSRGSSVYKGRLFDYLDTLIGRSGNPWYQAYVYHLQAMHSYHAGDHDLGRQCAVRAWGLYHSLGDRPNALSVRHMLGLIQTRRHAWDWAQVHLSGVYRQHCQVNNRLGAAHVYHALAFIPVEQQQTERALTMLVEALELAETIPDQEPRIHLMQTIQDDIEKVKSRQLMSEQVVAQSQ